MTDNKLYTCNCCGYKTIKERDNYEICPICNWEDEKINIDSLEETLDFNSCNYLSLFEAQENFIKQLTDTSTNHNLGLNQFIKDASFISAKEKVYKQIANKKEFLKEFFSTITPDENEEETFHTNLFKIVLEYLIVKKISNYNEKIIKIFRKNTFPTLNLSILSCLISFKFKAVEDFLISYIIDNDNIDSSENILINSYWKND